MVDGERIAADDTAEKLGLEVPKPGPWEDDFRATPILGNHRMDGLHIIFHNEIDINYDYIFMITVVY